MIRIEGRYILKLGKRLNGVGNEEVLHVGMPVSDIEDVDILGVDIGLLEDGESFLPPVIGKASRYNAHGKEVVRKDLPKESFDIVQYATWKDWHGTEHSGLRTITRERYPRDFCKPPSIYFISFFRAGQQYLISEAMGKSDDILLHSVNLFLEFFGVCYVYREVEGELVVRELRRLNWELLPKGEYPWHQAKRIIKDKIERTEDTSDIVLLERLDTIEKFRPDFVAVGRGGFKDYVVLGFTERDVYVFESSSYGNATYVFEGEWEEFSQLTKKEILDGDLHSDRVVHDRQWVRRIGRCLVDKLGGRH